MRAIFEKTLRNMFKPIILIIYFIILIFITILMYLGSREDNSLLVTIPSQIESIKTIYSLFVFIYLSGIALIIMMMIFGLDIFATEEYEGTMKILVAKPVSRSSIVLGKMIGLILGSLIYFISSLIVSITIFSIFSNLDKDVFIGLIKLIPNFLIYGIFMILIFSSIMSFLSSLFKKKVPSIIITVLLVLGIFGFLPILRQITLNRNNYFSSNLYYIDINAQFGNIYMSLIEEGKESNELYDQTISMYTGRYVNTVYDPDLENENYTSLKKNDVYNIPILFGIYLLFSFGLFYLSYRRMIKKDIT